MNKIKYKHQKTGQNIIQTVTQNVRSIMGFGMRRGTAPGVSKAHMDKRMYAAGYVRSGIRKGRP